MDITGDRRGILVQDTPELVKLHAKAVSNAIFSCLINAQNNPDDEKKWRSQADKLEQKFTTDYGKHYSYFLEFKDSP